MREKRKKRGKREVWPGKSGWGQGEDEDCRSGASSRTVANGVVILKYHDHISPRPTKNMPRRIELNLREPFCLSLCPAFLSSPLLSTRFLPRRVRPRETIPRNLNHVRITVVQWRIRVAEDDPRPANSHFGNI